MTIFVVVPDIEKTTRIKLKSIRDQLMKDMMNYYDGMDINGEVRLANIILLISSIKVHAQKTKENMHLMKIFDIIPRDKLFDEICGIAPTSSSSRDDSTSILKEDMSSPLPIVQGSMSFSDVINDIESTSHSHM